MLSERKIEITKKGLIEGCKNAEQRGVAEEEKLAIGGNGGQRW